MRDLVVLKAEDGELQRSDQRKVGDQAAKLLLVTVLAQQQSEAIATSALRAADLKSES